MKIRINLNKKDNMKAMSIIIILVLIIISTHFILKYYFGTWIRYGENNPPKGTIVWNTALSYNIEITRAGVIKGYYAKEKLDKNELKELKKLVKQIENSKVVDIDKDSENGLLINGKKYVIDEHNRDIYNKIINIIL